MDDVDEMNPNERKSMATAPRPVRRLLDPVLRKSDPNIQKKQLPPGVLLSRNPIAGLQTDVRPKVKKNPSNLDKSPQLKQGAMG